MHVMLNKGIGGMEEMFMNYNIALKDFCNVTSIIDKNCKRKDLLTSQSLHVVELNNTFGMISAIFHLRSIAKKQKFDVVIAHGEYSLTLTRIALIGLSIRNISVRHTFFSSKLSALKWRLKRDISVVINKKLIADIGENNTHVIYNVINCDLVSSLNDQDFRNHTIRIGFLGRIVQQKGIHFLVKALGLLINKKGLNCELIIGGNGRYLKALKNLIKIYGLNDKVKFLDYIDNKEEFFNNIDIFCLPSLKEAFGLVIIESMARGVPVVASNIPGIDEIVIHEMNGLLFTPGDYHDLANKIEMLITNKNKRNLFRYNALANIKQSYMMNRLQQDLYDLITNTVQEF